MTSLAPPPPRQHTFVIPDPLATALDVISPATLLALAKRYKWLLVAATLAGGSISLVKSLRVPIKYTATARFVMNSASGTASSIATALGLTVPSGGVFESPPFFVDLLKSREILWATANAPLHLSADSTKTLTAIQYLGLTDSTPGRLKNSAVGTLKSYVDAELGPNGVIRLSVTTQAPEFSSALANQLIEQGNRFLFEVRQRRIAGDRPFIERRLEIARNDMTEAETRLKEFMRNNKQYQNSPDLAFQFNHLQNEVSMRQQFYQSAVLSYEQTKIEQIRNTPVTSVIEAPDPPERPVRAINKKGIAVGAAAGFTLVAFLVLLLDLRRRVAFERAVI